MMGGMSMMGGMGGMGMVLLPLFWMAVGALVAWLLWRVRQGAFSGASAPRSPQVPDTTAQGERVADERAPQVP